MEALTNLKTLFGRMKDHIESTIEAETKTIKATASTFLLQQQVKNFLAIPPEERRRREEADRIRRREERLKAIDAS